MANKDFPLSLTIKAVDRVTAPLRQINERMAALTAPVRELNNSFRALSAEAGFPRLMQGFQGVGQSVGRVGHEAAALGLKLAALAGGAAYALHRIVSGAVAAGDELATMAQRVGLSVDAYAQIRFAADQADVEQEEFNAAMDQFNKRLGEAKAGGGSLLSFLQKVSPALALQVKDAKNTEEALALMTGAFEKVTDPGKRAALAAAAFGRSGLQMGQFLGRGNKAIEEQRRKYFALAGSQEAFAKGASDLDNATREMTTAFMGLRGAAGGALFPALTKLADALTKLLSGNREKIAAWFGDIADRITKWIDEGKLDELIDKLGQIAGTVRSVVENLGGLKVIAGLVAGIMAAPLLSAVAGLAGSFLKLGALVVPFVIRGIGLLLPVLGNLAAGFMSVNLAVAGPFVLALLGVAAAGYAIWKNWKDITEIFTTWQGALNMLKATLDLVIAPLESLKTAGQWWGKAFGITGGAPVRPTLGAAAAARPVAAQSSSSEARVKIDIPNLPRSWRVTADPRSTADLDFNLGYSMVTP